jgi:hypothetical protein
MLGNISLSTNTHAAIEELLDVSFCRQLMLYQRKVGNLFFPELIVYIVDG